MKAVRIHGYGGVEVLKYEEVEKPEPGEGQVRVKIEAVGVNFIDIYHRIGRYQGSLPLTLGQEGGGVVDAVGPNVTDFNPGDRVVYAKVRTPNMPLSLLGCSFLCQKKLICNLLRQSCCKG